jgi:hypothetical protein
MVSLLIPRNAWKLCIYPKRRMYLVHSRNWSPREATPYSMAQDVCCLPSSLGRTFLGAFLIQFPDLIDYALTPVIRLCPALIDSL